MERIRGETESKSGPGGADSHMHLRGGTGSPGDGSSHEWKDSFGREEGRGADGLRDRVLDTTGRLRAGAAHAASRLGDALDERTGLLRTIRSNPVAAIGVAFTVGFVVAAATTRSGTNRHWLIERTRRQLKTAVLGGMAATAARELRSFVSRGIEAVEDLDLLDD